MKALELKKLIREEVKKAIKESYFVPHGTDSKDVQSAKRGLANWFNNIRTGKISPQSAVTSSQLDILHDLIEEYAQAYAESYTAEG